MTDGQTDGLTDGAGYIRKASPNNTIILRGLTVSKKTLRDQGGP